MLFRGTFSVSYTVIISSAAEAEKNKLCEIFYKTKVEEKQELLLLQEEQS